MSTRSEFDRDLHLLEVELRRLEAEYNQFFAGRAPRLPWDQRTKVETMVKRLDRLHIPNTGDRFRFQTVQSRWVTFGALWERQLKAQEIGRRPIRPSRGAAAPLPKPPSPSSPPASFSPAAPPGGARDGVIATARLSDPTQQPERVRELYQELVQARTASGEKVVEFDRFADLVKAQVKELGSDGREVTFCVATKDGKVTLTAKPTGKD